MFFLFISNTKRGFFFCKIYKFPLNRQSNTRKMKAASASNILNIGYFLLGFLFVLFLFFCAFSVVPWVTDSWNPKNCKSCIAVNRETCSCSCFDGVYKMNYGRGRYKFIYFNTEWTTFIIFGITSFYILLFSRCVENIVRTMLSGSLKLFNSRIIVSIIMIALTIYPNFYAMWMHFNCKCLF